MYSKMLNERENSPTLLTAPEWLFIKEIRGSLKYQESWQHAALWVCVWNGVEEKGGTNQNKEGNENRLCHNGHVSKGLGSQWKELFMAKPPGQ